MADERERLTGEAQPIPAGYRWTKLAAPAMEGAELERHYRETQRVLGARGGMLGLISEKAQNGIHLTHRDDRRAGRGGRARQRVGVLLRVGVAPGRWCRTMYDRPHGCIV